MTPAAKRIREACFAHGVDYELGPRKKIAIPLAPAPVVLEEKFLAHVGRVSEAVNRHLVRAAFAWFEDPALHEVIVFPERERRFLESAWTGAPQTIVSRNDFDMPADPRDAVSFESNGCAIGGIWYGAACARAWVSVARQPASRPLRDGCDVFLEILRRHAKSIDAPGRFRLGILENRAWREGITEMPSIAKRLARLGHEVVIGDPRELSHGGRRLRGEKVDLLYRNMELADILEIRGVPRAMRDAFRANLVVSGLAGDFDQKSLWEVLTSRAYERHVARADRALLRKHLLWTRLVREIETEDPSGATVDLVPWMLRNRARLAIKPNLLCGGEGVTLGPFQSARAWERLVRKSIVEKGRWVVQRFHRASKRRFPRVGARYVTCGIISCGTSVNALGRASGDAVVNVSRGGGLIPLFVAR